MREGRRTGTIRVSIAGLKDPGLGRGGVVGARVDVLDRRLRLQRRASSREDIVLPPGRYVVAVTLPDGSRHTDPVEVQAGQTMVVDLGWNPAPAAAVKARARSRSGAKALLAPAPSSFHLRFIEIGGELEPTTSAAPPQKEIEDHTREQGVLGASMIIHAPLGSHRAQFAEVVASGHDPVAVALPTADVGEATTCRLNVAISAERVEADVQMRGSPDAETISQFMSSDQLMEAAVPEAAKAMLYGKLRHPYGAALGGYALLRLKEIDRLHEWPQNLATWFDWLPDAHIILGEQRLRQGRVAEAFASFRRALECGLPVFTDGFSIMQARLWALAGGTTIKHVPRDTMDEARRRLGALSAWTPWVGFDAVYTTLRRRGERPALTKAGGWQRFQPPFGPARDPRDFWSDPTE